MAVSFQNPNYLSGTSSIFNSSITGKADYSNFYNTSYLDSKYTYNDAKEGYEIGYSGRDAAITTKISNIASYLTDGREDKAMEAYNELLSEMGSQDRYGQLISENGDDTQLRAVARQLIEQNTGCNLEELIRTTTREQAKVDTQKILTWGNCDSTSQEDLLSAMCDIDQEEGHGNIITGLLSVVASPFVAVGNWLFNGGKKM